VSFSPGWQGILRHNPILALELRQALRSGRAILLLVVLAVLLGLVILAMGGAFGMGRLPPNFGVALFQVFFSLAYFVVTIIAPSLAAVGMSSEKNGRTWEALVLTGTEVRAIARGKFWAASLAMVAFVVMIAPASLLARLLGGVTIAELAIALALLAVIAMVAVAFGVFVGASAQATGSATLAAMASALLAAPVLYLAGGFGMSFLAHSTWPEVPTLPVWLPLAYVRAKFDGWYVLLLLALPVVVVGLAMWFFYEVTVARLSDPLDDRASRLKRWYLVALPLVTGIAAIPGFMTRGSGRLGAWLGGLGGLFLFLAFSALVLAGDVLAASPRVEFRWQKRGARWITRVLGPGLVQTSTLALVAGLLTLALYALVGAAALSKDGPRGLPPPASVALLACAEYWSAFFVFVVGFMLWSRARSRSIGGARIVSMMVSVSALAGPWIVFLIFGYASSHKLEDSLLVAAPSPLYAFVVVDAIERGEPHLALTSALVSSLGWISMGLVLFGLGARRATRAVAEQRTLHAHVDAQITHERGNLRDAGSDALATSEASS
jgi:hypothetical protein